MSGAERSLLELLGGLPDHVAPHVACPEGPLSGAVRELGVPVTAIPETEGSLKLDPWLTTRAVVDLGRAAGAVRRLSRRVGADLLHGNSIRSGLIGVLASELGGPPALAHIRDCLPGGRTSSFVSGLLCRRAAAIIANSQYTLRRFTGTRRPSVERAIHNSVDLVRFRPSNGGWNGDNGAIGVVAQLTPWKGQDDAIRTLALVKRAHPGARLILAGSAKFDSKATRYDNLAYVRGLEALIDRLDLAGSVEFLGERTDVADVYRALDVLLVPSWEEPFGRAVLEGMASGLPVLATNVGGPPEIIRTTNEGMLLAPLAPEVWADQVVVLLNDPALRERMGKYARERVAAAFTVERHVVETLDVYHEVLEGAAREPHRALGSSRDKIPT